ncbi:hypothetical protein MCEKH45_01933 [Methylophilaceae bacterium]
MAKGWRRIRLVFVMFWVLLGTWLVSPHYAKLFEERAFFYEPVTTPSQLVEMDSSNDFSYLQKLKANYPAYWNCSSDYNLSCFSDNNFASFLFASGYLVSPVQLLPNEAWGRLYVREPNGKMTYVTGENGDLQKWNEKFKNQIRSALKKNYLYALQNYFVFDLFMVLLLPLLIFQCIFYLLKWIKAGFNSE